MYLIDKNNILMSLLYLAGLLLISINLNAVEVINLSEIRSEMGQNLARELVGTYYQNGALATFTINRDGKGQFNIVSPSLGMVLPMIEGIIFSVDDTPGIFEIDKSSNASFAYVHRTVTHEVVKNMIVQKITSVQSFLQNRKVEQENSIEFAENGELIFNTKTRYYRRRASSFGRWVLQDGSEDVFDEPINRVLRYTKISDTTIELKDFLGVSELSVMDVLDYINDDGSASESQKSIQDGSSESHKESGVVIRGVIFGNTLKCSSVL